MILNANPKSMRPLSELRNRLVSALRWPACTVVLAAAACRSAMASRLIRPRRTSGLCNNTNSRIGIAIGYKDNEGWATEGWWNLPARNCDTLLRGSLAARFYYIYAVDYDHGGEWSGQAFMCTREKEFTIRGTGDCLARGFDRTGFFEVDTGEQQTWTVQLTEAGEGQRPVGAGQPPLTAPPAGSRAGPGSPSGPQ